jgi:pantoate--beta-alanine ligase
MTGNKGRAMHKALTENDVTSFISEKRKQKLSVGFVPTMGALHPGHLSLAECCKSENDITVVSVFVNPTQFNNNEDLDKYPRSPAKDLDMLAKAGCDLVFMPEIKTIYPQPDLRQFDFGELSRIMEGHFRPGHFNGVAQVVSRLFDIVKPDRAYFGKKDIQQLAVIRRLKEMLDLEVEIKACETIREKDGLAMSSRNVRLTPEQRKNAPVIYQTLTAAVRNKKMSVDELKKWVTVNINKHPFFDVEYFEIVRDRDLAPITNWCEGGDELIACIAVNAGGVRLIDNVFFPNFASS